MAVPPITLRPGAGLLASTKLLKKALSFNQRNGSLFTDGQDVAYLPPRLSINLLFALLDQT